LLLRAPRWHVWCPGLQPVPSAGAASSRLRFCSHEASPDSTSEKEADASEKKKKGRDPVDTTTALDSQRDGRFVERRIEEHVREYEISDADYAQAAAMLTEGQDKPAESALTEGSSTSHAPTVGRAPQALRLRDPNAAEAESKDIIVRSRTTTGQVLWPATPEDIEILSESKLLYPAPYEVEGSVIIRLVRLSDPVTSPVARVVRNRQFGIRGNEKWQLLAWGVCCGLLVYGFGFWQLRRSEWKRDLIEMRRSRLSMPRVKVTSSPFPWKDALEDYLYRVVEVRGVFDHRREMYVGPRIGTDVNGESVPGFLVVTPLRLEDSSTVLVNRGHIPMDRLDQSTRPELPKWVRVKGVLEEGEIPNLVGLYARLKNRPDKNQFLYLVSEELAENSGARNHTECSLALITALDALYEDDFQAGYRREMPFNMRHKEDYLLFWADEHTHFNYAMQWFGLGSVMMAMTLYKFIEVSRWRF